MKKALVIKSTGNLYTIKDIETQELLEAKLRGKFRLKNIKSTNPIVVGDYVLYSICEKKNILINDILERRNYISRRSVNLSKQNHIIASNIDQCILVTSILNPEISISFIDRYLATLSAYNIPVIIVFNKIDLIEIKDSNYLSIKNIYTSIGYEVLELSCKTSEGQEKLKSILKDKISVFTGNSGVGKSTIINKLNPELNLKTNKISDFHKKGQHTTTFSEMFEWSFGGYIIDTPGIKSFGIVRDIKKNDLKNYFIEFFKLSKNCKFNNCLHLNEPKCAILDALENGNMSYSRYKSYLSILDEISENKN